MGNQLPYVDVGGSLLPAPSLAVGIAPYCALLNDSTVKCWGPNSFGQLGQGDTNSRGADVNQMGDFLSPINFGSSVTSLFASQFHRCAVLTSGALKCWGWNASGQLGVPGSNLGASASDMPNLPAVALGTGRTAIQVGLRNATTCAVLDNGSIKCWGSNSAGQLGAGTSTASFSAPGAVAGVGDTSGCAGGSCNTTTTCSGVGSVDDGNPCTQDLCSVDTGPQHVPLVGAACNDGLSTTSPDTCDAHGVCVGVPLTLSDGNPCTHDVNTNGVYTHDPEPQGTPCPGGVCTGGRCGAAPAFPPPPDPSTYASALPPALGVSFSTRYGFLYSTTNPNAAQTADTVPISLDNDRVSVLHGTVTDGQGRPLPSIKIRVIEQPTAGKTISRADGAFDLAVNGGGPLTLVYETTVPTPVDASGYGTAPPAFFPVQRKVRPGWNEMVPVDTVVMTPPDDQFGDAGTTPTTIRFSTCTTQPCPVLAIRGRQVTDYIGTDETSGQPLLGSRQATILMPSDAVATVAGASTPLPHMTIRATEFTDATRGGPAAMPGDLSFGVAYTYAAEFSIDESPDPTKMVNFTRGGAPLNVPIYYENYLSFPVGTAVPVAYYDRVKTAWVPEPNGVVVQVTGYSGGAAVLSPAGIVPAPDAAELKKLAAIYPNSTGKTLVRVTTTHFTAEDHNFAWRIPDCNTNGGPCATDTAAATTRQDATKQDYQCGSVLECQARAAGESVEIAGTPFTLNYNSRRTPGYTAQRRVDVNFSKCDGSHTHANRIGICVEDANRYQCENGCYYDATVPFAASPPTDLYGRPLMGVHPLVGTPSARVTPLAGRWRRCRLGRHGQSEGDRRKPGTA